MIKIKDNKLAEGFFKQSVKLKNRAKQLFPSDEIEVYVPQYDDKTSVNHRGSYDSIKILQTISVMDHLLSYIDVKIGNPVAIELLDGTLDKASEMLKSGNCICAAVLIRLALEQGLKTLCEMNDVEFDVKDTAGKFNDHLKAAEILEQPVWREIQAKLDVLNNVIHNGNENCEADLLRVCSWVDNFLDNKLGGVK